MLDDRILETWYNHTFLRHKEPLDISKYKHQLILKELLDETDDYSLNALKDISNNLLLCEKVLSESDFENTEKYLVAMQNIKDFANGIDDSQGERVTTVNKVIGKYFNDYTEGKDPTIITHLYVSNVGNNSRKDYMIDLCDKLSSNFNMINYVPSTTHSKQGHLQFTKDGINYIFTVKELNDLKSSNKTDTDQKESLVALLYQIDVDLEPIEKEGFESFILECVTQIDKMIGVDIDTKEKLRIWLNNVENTSYVRNLINDSILIAGLMQECYPNERYQIDRDNIYVNLRNIIQTKYQLNPDKWNPSDLFLIKNEEYNSVDNFVKMLNFGLTEENKDEFLNDINNLFDLQFGLEERSLVGVSLKTTTSRFGTGKGYFNELSDVNRNRFNINKFEKDFNYEEVNQTLFKKLRNIIAEKVSSTNHILYECDFNPIEFDNIKLKSKYGNLKLLNFIIDTILETDNFDILKELIRYTLSMNENNPSYFILQGLHKEDRCDILEVNNNIIIRPHNDLIITDNSTSQTITLEQEYLIGESEAKITFIITNAGSTQPTINITKIEWRNTLDD